ncbi:cyclin-dependent kinase inhibitor 1 isoform X1 [Nelusetta ayraudi]|uniref:cyclin-dependent kinase inhibitor 1 isoform X1 n=2 Tax=Nelusetta ayraudi TaxID=303726 RepID=UPI003F7149A8
MCKDMASNKRVLGALRNGPLRNGPVRRNLFGPVDREQLRRDYQAALRKDLEEASTRWSFDFIRDQPLKNGDFQWEGVAGAKVPLLYRSRVPNVEVPEGRPAQAAAEPEAKRKDVAQSETESESEKENNVPGSPRRRAVNLLKQEKTPKKDGREGLKRKQTNITDFYEAKKRVVWMPRKSGE